MLEQFKNLIKNRNGQKKSRKLKLLDNNIISIELVYRKKEEQLIKKYNIKKERVGQFIK
ncbi:MAG: hypothetical protein ACLS49_04615 [Christensenellales bacterium]|jgi:hypothetical protein